MVLVSDLCEGGSVAGMLKTAARLKESGVQLICAVSAERRRQAVV